MDPKLLPARGHAIDARESLARYETSLVGDATPELLVDCGTRVSACWLGPNGYVFDVDAVRVKDLIERFLDLHGGLSVGTSSAPEVVAGLRVLGRAGEALSVAGPRVAELNIELPTAVYTEGSAIDATVLAMADRDVVVTGGDVELVRNMSYRYRSWGGMGGSTTATARRSEVVDRSVFHSGGPLPGGQPLVQQVRLQVPPDGPGSVRAELLEVSWAVHARLRTKGCRDAEATKHILVLSEARECAAVAQSAPLVEDRGCAVLGFESLSSRRLVGGLPLSGVLTVAPLRPVTARALRLDLVLLEHVAHGPWVTDDPARSPANEEKDAETLVASMALAGQSGRHRQVDPRSLGDWLTRIHHESSALLASGGICIEGQQRLRFPFRLIVPPRLQAPSVRTPDYSVRWMLRGVLDWRLHADPSVSLEMHAVTTHR